LVKTTVFLVKTSKKRRLTLSKSKAKKRRLLKTSKKRRLTFEAFFFTCPTLAKHTTRKRIAELFLLLIKETLRIIN